MRHILEKHKASAMRFRGVDWFSWITAGGSSVVILTNEIGVAEVLITAKDAWILTNRIERQRLLDEEVLQEFSYTNFDWQDSTAADRFSVSCAKGGLVLSDRPRDQEKKIPMELLLFKMKMSFEELTRYRALGRESAEAMTEAMRKEEPNWSENQLAGAGANALWSRGIEPTLILVAGAVRGLKYRHPRPTHSTLGASAMMVFCARRFGLYANLTRFIYFRPLTDEENRKFSVLEKIEADIIGQTRPGVNVNQLYEQLKQNYKNFNFEDEINKHHQGGPCGYLSRELIVEPTSNMEIEDNMVFAWNPSLPGAKREDTIVVHSDTTEILTIDPSWPSFESNGLVRSKVWIRQ